MSIFFFFFFLEHSFCVLNVNRVLMIVNYLNIIIMFEKEVLLY